MKTVITCVKCGANEWTDIDKNSIIKATKDFSELRALRGLCNECNKDPKNRL